VVVAGELAQLLDDDGPRRHVDPDGERLGGVDHLDESLGEAGLDRLLERRDHPRVVGGDAGLQASQELPVPEDREIPFVEGADVLVDDLPDAVALRAGRQPHTGRGHGPGGLVASVAAEDERDRRQHRPFLEPVQHLQSSRRVELATGLGATGAPDAAHGLAVEPVGLGVGPALDQGRQQMQAFGRAVADEVEALQ
jgi:hypothetical protein